jgi:intracellular multiplication protein IcmO
MNRLPNVEQRHEIKTGQQIIDPRTMFAKFAEWLGLYHNLVIASVPAVVLTGLAPVMALVTLPYLLIITLAHMTMKSILPVRYPMGFTDEKGKPGTGIMYVGAVDSVSEYEEFKEIWLSDDDMRKHMLILGSTGSGKSEALKALFYNALNWSSGFFIADGKADNKLPTDVYTMCRSVGRDQDLLILNFLLAGKTPEQVRRSRRRRTNMLNPFPSADADTIIQMGSNLLPKVEGDAKNWQEKALNLWRSVVQALAYKRDTQGFDLSISVFIEYMSLGKVEELYLEGYYEAQNRDGEWSYGFAGIKNYLESGVPGYMIAKLLRKNGIGVEEAPASPTQMKRPGQAGKEFEQDSMAYEQHSYRTNQLMPVLNLLDKTYGFIFRAKYPEIDMSDVTLRNRILVMLIPSLEKSASEAENLGKLSIACLRVMMSKNLGAEVEGDHEELLGSKATNSPYPYLVALDELAYYFSDGIAVMFAQARSLGTAMVAAAQDLEKLTEGSRAAEAGAMIANTTTKFFMRIDDTGKTAEMIQKVVGKATVALKRSFKFNGYSYNRKADVEVTEVDRVSTQRLQSFGAGEGVVNAMGRTTFMKWFYMGKDIEKHRVKAYFVNRFLQVAPPSNDDVIANSIAIDQLNDPYRKGRELVALLRQERVLQMDIPYSQELTSLSAYAASLSPHLAAEERAILLYMRLRELLVGEARTEVAPDGGSRTSRSSGGDQSHKQAPRIHGHDGFNGEVKPEEVAAEEDVLAEHPLSFLLSTPFARKPAAEVLDGLEEEISTAQGSADMSALYLDPVQTMISSGRTMSLDAGATLKGKALALLVGAPSALSDPITGLPIETKDDWIGAALHRACEMVASPRSSDRTVVGFSPETMRKVVEVEQIMRSPSPQLAGKSFERVVAEKVTPSTVPDNIGVDVTMDEMDAFFAKLTGQSGQKT